MLDTVKQIQQVQDNKAKITHRRYDMFKRAAIITILIILLAVSVLPTSLPMAEAQETGECIVLFDVYEVIFDPEGEVYLPIQSGTWEVEYMDAYGNINLFRLQTNSEFVIAPDGIWEIAYTDYSLDMMDSKWDAPAEAIVHPGNFQVFPHYEPGLAYFSPYLFLYDSGGVPIAAIPAGSNCPGGGWHWSGG